MNLNEEQQLRQEADRGRRAQELLDDELMVEAFSLIRTKLTNEWADSPARDTEGREKLWLMLKLLSSVEGHLKTVLETGKMANVQLTQQRNLMDRAKAAAKELWL